MRKFFFRLLAALYRRLGIASPLYYVNAGEALPPPLSREEESACIRALGEGDESVKQTLIERNLRLVVYIARKFENTGVNIEDLISIGTIGLIKAVNTFDTTKKIKLATYASRCIENEILMHLSDILGTDGDLVYRSIEDEVDRELLALAMGKLTPREKQIMELRFGLSGKREYTQKQVADMLGISQSYISRLEKHIIKVLRKEIISMS